MLTTCKWSRVGCNKKTIHKFSWLDSLHESMLLKQGFKLEGEDQKLSCYIFVLREQHLVCSGSLTSSEKWSQNQIFQQLKWKTAIKRGQVEFFGCLIKTACCEQSESQITPTYSLYLALQEESFAPVDEKAKLLNWIKNPRLWRPPRYNPRTMSIPLKIQPKDTEKHRAEADAKAYVQ